MINVIKHLCLTLRGQKLYECAIIILLAIFYVELAQLKSCVNKQDCQPETLYFSGFFPTSHGIHQGEIGRGVLPAVALAISHINSNPKIIPGYKLEIIWNNTNCDAAVGMKAFFDLMDSPPNKLMLFGAACTIVTDPIAKAATFWNLTQLSYADTHPMFTSRNYPNLFRIVPSETDLNPTRLSLLNHFNWTRVGTLYQNDARHALVHNSLMSDLERLNYDIVATLGIGDEVILSDHLDKLKEKDARIILGEFNETWAFRIFCQAYKKGMFGRKYQWVISGMYRTNWLKEESKIQKVECLLEEVKQAMENLFLADIQPLKRERKRPISGKSVSVYKREYDKRRRSEYSRFHGYAYDGVWTIALAIQRAAQILYADNQRNKINITFKDFKYRSSYWGNLFHEAMKSVAFQGVTGPVSYADNHRKGFTCVKQYHDGKETKIGEYDGINNVLTLNEKLIYWHEEVPPVDRSLILIQHRRINLTIYASLSTAACLGIIMACTFLGVNIKYRKQRLIKMSSPNMNNIIIIGCILAYTSIILLGLDSPLTSEASFPYICAARAWVLMAGFTLAYGSMFSKTWRVHSIFTNIKISKKIIKDYQLFIIVVILLTIDVAIMTTWQIIDPFYRATRELESYADPHNENILIVPQSEYCESKQMTIFVVTIYSYKGLLMVFGCFLAWETRHVNIPALNDSKYIGLSVYNAVIMCVIGAVVPLILSDQPDASFIIISIFIMVCTTGTLCLVFVPKIIQLRKNPDGLQSRRIRATIRPPEQKNASDEDHHFKEYEKVKKENNELKDILRKKMAEKNDLNGTREERKQDTEGSKYKEILMEADTVAKNDKAAAVNSYEVTSPLQTFLANDGTANMNSQDPFNFSATLEEIKSNEDSETLVGSKNEKINIATPSNIADLHTMPTVTDKSILPTLHKLLLKHKLDKNSNFENSKFFNDFSTAIKCDIIEYL